MKYTSTTNDDEISNKDIKMSLNTVVHLPSPSSGQLNDIVILYCMYESFQATNETKHLKVLNNKYKQVLRFEVCTKQWDSENLH